MAKKKSGKKSGRRGRAWRPGFPSPGVLFQLGIILLLCAAAYILWLDHRITREFEGKRWSLPARVYARPYEIFTGRPVGAREIVSELQTLNYHAVTMPRGAGEYRRAGSTVEVVLRPFRYWDGAEPARHVRLDLSGNRVTRITDVDTGREETFVRLEPRLIGKIYPEHNEDRVLVPYSEVPPFLVDALVAVEDRHFYQHWGIDLRGIGRALLANLRSGGIAQGGSTLTQQLVKNFFLTPERTFTRKFNEMIMAVLLEYRYSKAEILSAYINEVYLGQNGAQGIHGFGTAAEFYFGEPLTELDRDQLALLVGLVRGASYYNPRRHPERALTRRNLVLSLMTEQGYLREDVAGRLKSRPVEVVKRQSWSRARYPGFLQLVRHELLRYYRMQDLRSEGLRIFTTLDPERQEHLQTAIRRRLRQLEQSRSLEQGALETAAIEYNISNGEILAMMGGRDENIAGFNRVLNAKRPIGSLIKPFVYYTALSRPKEYHLLSGLNDSAVRVREPDGDIWEPKNYGNEEHGRISLLEALTRSYNLATVRLGMQLGVDSVIETLHRAGLKQGVRPYPSVLLGALALSPYQVATLYQTLANGGYSVPLKTIRDVLDRHGRPLQREELTLQQSLDPQASFLTGFLLSQVVERGTARHLREVFPDSLRLAGKTGTTNDSRDSWFVGYDDRLLTVAWLGRDDYSPTPFTGASGAMQLWAAAMKGQQLHSLNLASSDLIEWRRDVSLPYAGECVTLDAVPYIRGFPPQDGVTCEGGASGSSIFNPLRWFQ